MGEAGEVKQAGSRKTDVPLLSGVKTEGSGTVRWVACFAVWARWGRAELCGWALVYGR